MAVELRKGDVIVLSVPSVERENGEGDELYAVRAQDVVAPLREAFQDMGVRVGLISFCDDLPDWEIKAVFRDTPPAP